MLQQTFPKIITFNSSIDKQLPYILADHTQIHQALLNLCVNARDAMPQGGEISVTITKIAGEKIKDRFPQAENIWYVNLCVSDTGMGMNESTRSQIFDPFFTTKEKGKGTGLGLSVVYGIVQAHHGFVHVDSTPEHGTTFFLYFPVPQETKAALEVHDQTIDKISGGNETLLFVEDESLLLEMVQILLESNGYAVYTAKDGEEAVQIYQEHSSEIALVISDMGLPKLTGISEFEKMKEINPSIKIIFASGYFEPNMKAALEHAGVKGFLQKPYVIEDILSKIRKTLDSN
jgi:two-component system, cell cycle sensor histidine kinase and response regulator CckA